jgi:hypothetical protein
MNGSANFFYRSKWIRVTKKVGNPVLKARFKNTNVDFIHNFTRQKKYCKIMVLNIAKF